MWVGQGGEQVLRNNIGASVHPHGHSARCTMAATLSFFRRCNLHAHAPVEPECAGEGSSGNRWRTNLRGTVAFLYWALFLIAFPDFTWAQSLSGQWTSEGPRAEIEIYSCGAAGQDVSNQQVLDTLCSYVTDKGPRLCGRVAKVLPKGLAELQAKGKKAEDVLGHPVLCVAGGPDQTWPWKGGVFNLDDSTPYWVRLSPQGPDKLKGSACGLGGWYCPSKGEFVWTKIGK